MKATRQYVMNLLKTNLPEIKTFISGYPFMLKNEWCPLITVYSDSETVNWKATGNYESILDLQIMIGADASKELNSDNRGTSNEDFLNDTAQKIKDILFKNPQPDDNTILQGITQIEYRANLEVAVRLAVIRVRYRKLYTR